MKTAVLFYISHCNDWCISRISDWADTIPDIAGKTFCGPAATEAAALLPGAAISQVTVTDTATLLQALSEAADAAGADTVVFAFGDSPFYDQKLTRQLYDQHITYAAEYSFADGYPQGLVPEMLYAGTVKILQSLALTAASAPVSRECLFNLLKTDINSFEIETLLAPKDFRAWRLDFTLSTQEGRIICNRLRELTEHDGNGAMPTEVLCQKAIDDVTVLHPVPAYYNVQISGSCGSQHCLHCPFPGMKSGKESLCQPMSLDQFQSVLDKIAAVSEKAVVSLSLWGEPFQHPDLVSFVAAVLARPGFSCLIETSLTGFAQDILDDIAAVPDAATRVIWICALDAATEETWQIIHPDAGFTLAEAQKRADVILQRFPGQTYVQFVRMNENESELEAFYRGHENRLIQKYDDFCGMQPDRKPADLSPVQRFPCWHLRRDLAILSNGDVPLCRERLGSDIIGNIFRDDLNTIWQKSAEELQNHVAGTVCDQCRKCDEYYTFNF